MVDHREESSSGRHGLLTRPVKVPRWVAALVILLIVALFFVAGSLLQGRSARVGPMELVSFRDLLPSIAGVTQGRIVDGNSVEIIQDAEFFDRLIADIDAATETVHFETFVWWRGRVCRRLADAFVRAADRGVTVRVLLDAWGTRRMAEDLRRSMEEAGVSVLAYHPIRPGTIGVLNNRDHRKLAIVDGRIGYAFGHGTAEEWDRDGGSDPWQDTAVRVEGPLVTSLQTAFLDNWIPVSREVPTGKAVFPELEPMGSVRGHVVMSSGAGPFSLVKVLYKLAIASAQEEILIQTPYFVPDSAVVELLVAAVDRGVRVRLMVPGPEVIDSRLVCHASHTRYDDLLEGGIEILEYRPSLLHKKIVVVDQIWSHVGSTNFDSRSLEINDEVSVGLIDRGVAAVLVREFERDARRSRRLDPRTWRPSWAHRLLDASAATLQEQL